MVIQHNHILNAIFVHACSEYTTAATHLAAVKTAHEVGLELPFHLLIRMRDGKLVYTTIGNVLNWTQCLHLARLLLVQEERKT
jgi:hypothetical protein